MPNHLSQEQVDAYKRNGFVGPIDLLTTQEAADLRRKVEDVEAEMGMQIQQRCKIKAHLPFKFLCDVISTQPCSMQLKTLLVQIFYVGARVFFRKKRMTQALYLGIKIRPIMD